MGDLARRAVGHRQRWRPMRPSESRGGEPGLASPRVGQRRLGLTLEPSLDDELRLSVTEEDDRGVEAVRDHVRP